MGEYKQNIYASITVHENKTIIIENKVKVMRTEPDGVWWFGAGYSCDGAHIQLDRLQQSGFQNGEEARKALLESIVDFRM